MLYVCYTYPVSRMTYTDEYRACIWTSLNWRVTLYKCFVITIIYIYIAHIYDYILKYK